MSEVREMIKSAYRDLPRAIKLEKGHYRSYEVNYYPLAKQKKKILLASIDTNEGIQLYSDNIGLVPGREEEICKTLVKYLNQACKELSIKTPHITVGYYLIGYKSRNAGSYKLCYYSKLYKEWVISHCYCLKEEDNYDFLLAVRVELNPYHYLEQATKSFNGIYWSDTFYSLTGVVYLPIRDITPEVAKDILLYQIEYDIEPSKFLQSRLNEEGREVLDTVNNLLTLKEVS